MAARLEAANAWHHDIEQDDIRRALANFRQPGACIGRFKDHQTDLFEAITREEPNEGIVVDDQSGWRWLDWLVLQSASLQLKSRRRLVA